MRDVSMCRGGGKLKQLFKKNFNGFKVMFLLVCRIQNQTRNVQGLAVGRCASLPRSRAEINAFQRLRWTPSKGVVDWHDEPMAEPRHTLVTRVETELLYWSVENGALQAEAGI